MVYPAENGVFLLPAECVYVCVWGGCFWKLRVGVYKKRVE